MTIADLMVGLLCMPIRGMIFLFQRSWIFGQTFCHIFIGIQNALPGVSVFGVVIISFDRYLATTYPLRHLQWKSKKLAMTVSAITWVIPLLLWFGISTIWDLVKPLSSITASGFCQPNYAQDVVISLIVALLRACIPFCTVVLLSIKIYHKARSTGSNEHGKNDFRSPFALGKGNTFTPRVVALDKWRADGHSALADSARSRKMNTDGNKALRTLAFLVVAFFITWLPSTLVLFLRSAVPTWYLQLPFEIPLRESVRWIVFCNSMINPLAYALAQPLFHKAIFKVCCRRGPG
ncbi:alpha-1A adrenergic receptor-like [Diadema setosum]|uniref:alpha-1A adrenergic receptor-like n=1 Tax=Diadema setosum TaxID=31175 RepID=UPI003B3B9F60